MTDVFFEKLVSDSVVALPMLGWAILGLLVLCGQIIWPSPKLSLGMTIIGLLTLLIFSAWTFSNGGSAQSLFAETAVWDSLSQFFNILSLIIGLAVVLMLVPGLDQSSKIFSDAYTQLPEFLMCLLFSGFGVSVMSSATDLTTLFLGLETLSIGIYSLCGFYRTDIRSTESAFKYLLIGAFSTVVFLYGVAFVYGATGATSYQKILMALQGGASPLLVFGIVFLIAGFAFKLALVHFHLYTPDVYEGAPTPVTAYMATILKVGASAAALRVFWGFLSTHTELWQPLWLSICTLSILIGNIGALQQKTVKRLLAFSGISHAGFIGLALVVSSPGGGNVFSLISYLVVYSAMSFGTFAMVHYLEDRTRPFLLEDLRGLSRSRFWSALSLSLFLLGMAGIPPFAGFMIKFWVLQGLVEAGHWTTAFGAVVGSVIGAAYYLRLLIFIFVSEESGGVLSWAGSKDRLMALRIVAAAGLIITVLGSIRPQIYTDWILSTLALK